MDILYTTSTGRKRIFTDGFTAINSYNILMKYLFLTAIFFYYRLPLPLLLKPRTDEEFRIARVQYRGGGDWYSSPTALTNMLRFAKSRCPSAVSSV